MSTKPGRTHRAKATAGYTLMEMLLLLAILGILLAIVTPNLIRWADKMRIDGAVRQVAMQLSVARLKAVTTGFPVQASLVGPGVSYPNMRGDGSAVISVRSSSIVVEGDEDPGDVGTDFNLNGLASERLNPVPNDIPDLSLCMVLPRMVFVPVAPPAPLPGNPGATTVVFQPNGLANAQISAAEAIFTVYLTNQSATENFAVSVWHSGRVKTHQYRASQGWREQ